MLGGIYAAWRGRVFGNQVADFIGMHRSLYHGAMEEGGCNMHMLMLSHLKSEGYAVEAVAQDSCKFLIAGLRIIENKFGQQAHIDHARACVMNLMDNSQS